jgi:peptide-methionine (S)-S-oxide reductase
MAAAEDVRALIPSAFPIPAADFAEPDPAAGRLTLAGGCFWCVEQLYRDVVGVTEVLSGYSGGTAADATYRAVCSGRTRHAEAVEIRYDPARVRHGELLRLFFAVAHDPTQLDRQGADVGRQYRSALFYRSDAEKAVFAAYIRQLTEMRAFARPIVTTLEPLETFHLAEAEHQDYARRNPFQPYIRGVSMPKLEKLRAYFPDKIKR